MSDSKIGKVYKIISPSNKIYIGSTISDIKRRWSHYYSLNCKGQTKLYNSFIKYGAKNHIFEVIWEGNTNEMLKQESIFGNLYNVLDKHIGLNCKLPKESDNVTCVSDETREKLKFAKLGKKQSEETKLKRSLSNKGQVISIEQRLAISKANKGRKMSNQQKESISKRQKGRKDSEAIKLKRGNAMKKSILQYDLEGNFIREWYSIKDAGISLGISVSGISSACTGRQKRAGKFKWEYLNESVIN